SLGQIKPGLDMDGIVKLRKENDGGGPHSITGPIYVSGAEPGDTLEVRILRIVPKPDAFNFNLPGRDFPTVGLLAPEFPEAIVRKDLKTDWPWAETKSDWIFMGYDEDLNQAMKIAVEQTVHWLASQQIVPMSREEAYALASIVGDCRVTQVVDIRKGVHCMI